MPVPALTVNWLEVALYWEKLSPPVGLATPGEIGDGLGGTVYADSSTLMYAQIGIGDRDDSDSSYGAGARSALRWLRSLEVYGIAAEADEDDFQECAIGRSELVRFVNFTTSARSMNSTTLVRFSCLANMVGRQVVAIGNDADPASVSVWSWRQDAVSQVLQGEYEGGGFHPETELSQAMTGEDARWPAPV